MERELVREEEEIRVYPNPFVRTDWGSFYTPDDLVALVIEEAVGPLADARRKAFHEAVSKSASAAELARLDPATKILELKVCELRQPAKLTYPVWRSQRSYDTSVWPVDGFARAGETGTITAGSLEVVVWALKQTEGRSSSRTLTSGARQ